MKARKVNINWDAYDWSVTTDSEIAEECGRSRERVRQIRRDPSNPKEECIRSRQRKGTSRDQISSRMWEGKTPDEVAKSVNCTPAYAKQCLHLFKKSFREPPDSRRRWKYSWDSLTRKEYETLEDKVIAKRLGVANPGVITQWRRRRGIRKRVREQVRELVPAGD